MTTKYLIKSKSSQAIVEYNQEGLIEGIRFELGETEARSWLLTQIPRQQEQLMEFLGKYAARLKGEMIPADLSFNAFWNLYDYKVGKKDKTVQLWTALTEAERTACLRAIPRYRQWLSQRPSMERLYPQIFLHQRRWENEFRV
jgi:hypothetical protein